MAGLEADDFGGASGADCAGDGGFAEHGIEGAWPADGQDEEDQKDEVAGWWSRP